MELTADPQAQGRPSAPAFQDPPLCSWLQGTSLTMGANLGRWMSLALQDSPLLGGHTDVQSWSLGLNQVLDAALRRKGKALTPLQA